MRAIRPNRLVRNNEPYENSDTSESLSKLTPEKLAQLHEAKQRMMAFIATIKQRNSNPSLNPVFSYCGKFENQKTSSQEIIKMTQQRIQKMIKNQKVKKNWGKEDVSILTWTLAHYMNLNNLEQIKQLLKKDWEQISSLIPGSTSDSCMFKLLNLKNNKITEKKWMKQEQDILTELMEDNKNEERVNWRRISEQLYQKNYDQNKTFRTAKQCKEHWASFLNEQMKKGPWDIEQDIQMLEFIMNNKGHTKWANMVKKICCRTENALKNRYNLLLKQERATSGSENQIQLIQSRLVKLYKERDNLVKKNTRFQQKIISQESQKFRHNFEDGNDKKSKSGETQFRQHQKQGEKSEKKEAEKQMMNQPILYHVQGGFYPIILSPFLLLTNDGSIQGKNNE